MTSPDRKVPSGAYVGSSAPNNVANLQTVTWAGVERSTVANLYASYQGVTTASQNMNGDNAVSAASAQAAGSDSGTAQSTGSAAQNTAAANSASIATLLPPPPPPTTPGTTLTDNFARATLGPNYTTVKSGQVADLIIASNQVRLDPNGSNSGTGSAIALNTTALQTDSQSVSVVMGAANNAGNSATGIILRADPQLATFAYAWVYSTVIYIGSGTRANGTNSYSDWTSVATSVNTGDTVTFTAVGSTYQVLVNNYPVVGYSDGAGTVPTGSGHRSVGFGCSYVSGKFSFSVAGFTAADQQPAPVTGIGWSLVRSSTTGAARGAGAMTRLTGVFDTVRQANNVSIISLGAGQVQVNRAGWYLISIAYNFSALDYSMRTELWSAPSPGGSWGMVRAGAVGDGGSSDSDGNPTGDSYCTSGSFVVYLPKGALVAPGLSTNTSNSLVGPFTCFDGALLNWL
ncbi:hypothetical protein OHB26_16380 [Nocardia sp. NBC_01503]|uniref:hypothetical protein n=1 Tax=Nocardia sp. NBC_01503 TaxID=2975997 RepID=UPI002E7C3F22|nr:hypothetical protein [Nocardia sp. NBC_01503]WTL35628.1 hypothetical protein OHB26_16380 [Nocardia sp. NBC_01503]